MPVTLRKRASDSMAPSTSPAERSSANLRKKHVIEVPDPDFHNFDSTRTGKDIRPGQIWAIYDDKDGMPRYYGRISSVSPTPFKVEFWWLVYDQRSIEESRLWVSRSGYYLSTGEFDNGEYSTSKVVNIFSHRMHVKEQFLRGASSRFKIYPRIGDVWAMYRDWDQVPRSTESPSNVVCKFDMVEILVEYSKENGVKTVKLEKVPSFRTVFRRQDGPQAIRVWRTSDLLKFSHTVPAVKIKHSKHNQLLGIPKQALELDPAAIPLGYSDDMEKRSQLVEDSRDTEVKRDTPVTEMIAVGRLERSQDNADSVDRGTHDSVRESEEITRRPQRQKSSRLSVVPAIVNSPFQSCSELNALKNLEAESDTDFYDFNSLRTEADLEEGQIWAIYDTMDKMPRMYVRVVQVLGSPFKLVDVWRLKPDPCSEKMKSWMDCTGLSMSCGGFKNDRRDVMGLDCFSHLLLDRANNRVKIFPRKGEVWAMYRSWDFEHGRGKVKALGTLHIHGYDLVELLSDFLGEGSLEIVRLAEVTGFKSLFERKGKPVFTEKVPPDFLLEFSHSIPARKMYKDDTLRIPFGALEVDPACIVHCSPASPMAVRAPNTKR